MAMMWHGRCHKMNIWTGHGVNMERTSNRMPKQTPCIKN